MTLHKFLNFYRVCKIRVSKALSILTPKAYYRYKFTGRCRPFQTGGDFLFHASLWTFENFNKEIKKSGTIPSWDKRFLEKFKKTEELIELYREKKNKPANTIRDLLNLYDELSELETKIIKEIAEIRVGLWQKI